MKDDEWVDLADVPNYGVPVVVITWLTSGLGKNESLLNPNEYRRDEHSFQIKLSAMKRLRLILENLKKRLREEFGDIDEETVGQQLGESRLRYLVDKGWLKPSYFFNGLNFFRAKEVERYIATAPTPKEPRFRAPAKKPDPDIIRVINSRQITPDLMSIQRAAFWLRAPVSHSAFYNWVIFERLLPVVKISDRQQKGFMVRRADVEALLDNPLFQKLVARSQNR